MLGWTWVMGQRRRGTGAHLSGEALQRYHHSGHGCGADGGVGAGVVSARGLRAPRARHGTAASGGSSACSTQRIARARPKRRPQSGGSRGNFQGATMVCSIEENLDSG